MTRRLTNTDLRPIAKNLGIEVLSTRKGQTKDALVSQIMQTLSDQEILDLHRQSPMEIKKYLKKKESPPGTREEYMATAEKLGMPPEEYEYFEGIPIPSYESDALKLRKKMGAMEKVIEKDDELERKAKSDKKIKKTEKLIKRKIKDSIKEEFKQYLAKNPLQGRAEEAEVVGDAFRNFIDENQLTEEDIYQKKIDKDEEAEPETFEEFMAQSGQGRTEGGLWDYQIKKVLRRYPQFHGVYSIDEFNKIPVSKKFGVVINLSKANEEGTHWVALYVDAVDDMSIEYYDSYAEEPPKAIMKGVKQIIDKLMPNVYLKFKVNKIKQQKENSNNCGWFSILFLTKRFEGIPFKLCSGYSQVMKSEHNIEKFKEKFGFI